MGPVKDFFVELGHMLLGTCDSIDVVLKRMGCVSEDLNTEYIEDRLLDYNIERCQCCGWWFESGELFSDNEEECGKCKDCRK